MRIYNKNKTSYNMNIKHIIGISTFATFQQPYIVDWLLLIIYGYLFTEAVVRWCYVKKVFLAGVFLWSLQNFQEYLFLQDTFDGCFCTYSLSTCRYLFIYLFIHLFIYLPSIAILVTYTN